MEEGPWKEKNASFSTMALACQSNADAGLLVSKICLPKNKDLIRHTETHNSTKLSFVFSLSPHIAHFQ